MLWKEGVDAEPDTNPWSVKLSTMFHMSNDSGLFRTLRQLEEQNWRLNGNIFERGEERYLPLYEAKLFHQYDHRFATFTDVSEQDSRKGNTRAMTSREKQDPDTVIVPRYWVPESEVLKKITSPHLTSPHLTSPHLTDVTRVNPTNRDTHQTGHQLALRMITRVTDERTAFSSMIPFGPLGNSGALMSFAIWHSGILQAQPISGLPSPQRFQELP